MNGKSKKIKILCLVFAFILTAMLCVSCSGRSNKTLLNIEDKQLSLSTYEFLLTRMKGTLELYGYDVFKESFWNTIISSDGMTYDEYFKTAVLEQAYNYVVAEYLFELEGLSLTDEETEVVEKLMQALEDKAGSKNNLNSELSQCGINRDMLEDIYILEAKVAHLKAYYYGEDGEKIDKGVKDEYYSDNYVCFKQVFLASYYYVTETDKEGNTIYFTDEKAEKIAYDTEKGSIEKDEFGNVITDEFGDPVYYDEDGNIAYDTENGVVSYLEDSDGEKISEFYDNDKKAEIKEKADSLLKQATNTEEFEKLITENSESEVGQSRLYLFNSPGYYGSQSSSASYLDDIASALSDMENGECRVVESDYGYHIICKYENEENAYENEEYEDIFGTFTDDLITKLFSEKCAEYKDSVIIDSEVWNDSYSMFDVASNTLY